MGVDLVNRPSLYGNSPLFIQPIMPQGTPDSSLARSEGDGLNQGVSFQNKCQAEGVVQGNMAVVLDKCWHPVIIMASLLAV